MKIYTKTGDQGETGLFGGGRVRKDHPRIVAYGEVDELNAGIGAARAFNRDPSVDGNLKQIQNDLFDIGAILATPDTKKLEGKSSTSVRKGQITFLEQSIDRMEKDLPPLRQFILPGGSEVGSLLHLSRTVCRRAEREIIALSETEKVDADLIVYINRLSDYLFVLARWVNVKKGVVETPWEKK